MAQRRRASAAATGARGGARRWALAAGLLLLVFVVARFPYERLLPRALGAARAATGAEITVGSLGPGLGLAGPELRARGVVLAWPGAAPLTLDSLRVRPAWSLGWLRGSPVWHLDASSSTGRFVGALGAERLAAEWQDVDVDALPWMLLGATPPLHGRVSGEADLTGGGAVWQGRLELGAHEGSVDLPGLPVAIPYTALAAVLELAPEAIRLTRGRIEGPLVTARMEGSASGNGGALASWPLALEVEIESIDPALQGYLAPLGIPVGAGGITRAAVGGTLSAPILGGFGSS